MGLLAGGIALGAAARAPAALAGERLPLRLSAITYNTWGLPAPFTVDPARFPEIAKTIPQYDADVIAFEETFTSDADALGAMPQYPFRLYGPSASSPVQISSGVLLVSKWPIVQSDMIEYSDCTGSDCMANKGAVYAKVSLSGGASADVFATHLDAADTGEVRLAQIRELAEFVRYYHDPALPLVMLGDFNMNPDSPEYEELRSLISVEDSHDVYVEQHPELSEQAREGLTIDLARNPYARQADADSGRIDYAWYSAPSTGSAEIADSELIMDFQVGGRFLSDHFGLLTVFNINY